MRPFVMVRDDGKWSLVLDTSLRGENRRGNRVFELKSRYLELNPSSMDCRASLAMTVGYHCEYMTLSVGWLACNPRLFMLKQLGRF